MVEVQTMRLNKKTFFWIWNGNLGFVICFLDLSEKVHEGDAKQIDLQKNIYVYYRIKDLENTIEWVVR